MKFSGKSLNGKYETIFFFLFLFSFFSFLFLVSWKEIFNRISDNGKEREKEKKRRIIKEGWNSFEEERRERMEKLNFCYVRRNFPKRCKEFDPNEVSSLYLTNLCID